MAEVQDEVSGCRLGGSYERIYGKGSGCRKEVKDEQEIDDMSDSGGLVGKVLSILKGGRVC